MFKLSCFKWLTTNTIIYNIAIIFFHHTLVESATFAPGSETRMRYFRPGSDEKSYMQHGDKEGHPRAHVCHPRLRLAIYTCSGLANSLLPLLCNILYL